jgi:acyl-CoA thioester hydrolase
MTRIDDDVLVARAENTVVTVSPAQHPVPIPADLRAHLHRWAGEET